MDKLEYKTRKHKIYKGSSSDYYERKVLQSFYLSSQNMLTVYLQVINVTDRL
jgi:hypothetical protein